MGYGKNLENKLKERGLTVKEVAAKAKIRPTTLYSAIQKDISISYGNAIKLSRVLHPAIDIRTICDDVPADDPTILRTPLSEYLKLGEKMKAARIKAGFTQEEMADMLSLRHDTYSGYENGYSEPSSEIILQFCAFAHTNVGELLGIRLDTVPESVKDNSGITFGQLRLLFNSTYGDTVIILFDDKNEENNLEISPNHPILNAYESSEVQYITTLPGRDGNGYIAICLKQN